MGPLILMRPHQLFHEAGLTNLFKAPPTPRRIPIHRKNERPPDCQPPRCRPRAHLVVAFSTAGLRQARLSARFSPSIKMSSTCAMQDLASNWEIQVVALGIGVNDLPYSCELGLLAIHLPGRLFSAYSEKSPQTMAIALSHSWWTATSLPRHGGARVNCRGMSVTPPSCALWALRRAGFTDVSGF